MDFNEYQEETKKSANYPNYGIEDKDIIPYLAIGLTGESGEIANKIKKIMRGDYNIVDARMAIANEIGDVLWYCSELAYQFGFELEEIAYLNIQKMKWREANNSVMGEGDNR